MLESEMIHHSVHKMIDHRIDVCRPVVECRHRWDDHRSRLTQPQHVFEMNRRQRSLARHKHEPSPFLQTDVRGSMQKIARRSRSENSDRGRRARYDDHRIDRVRSRSDRSADVAGMKDHRFLRRLADQLRYHLFGVGALTHIQLVADNASARTAHYEVDLSHLYAVLELNQQTLSVYRAA